jgi:hypothetical protein
MIFNFLKVLYMNYKNLNDNIHFSLINNVIHKIETKSIKYHYSKSVGVETTITVNGILHCESDLSSKSIIFPDKEDEKLNVERWFKNDCLHRCNDKPAYIEGLHIKKWYNKGLLHRDNDKPAIINFGDYQWFQYGVLHRDVDKPSLIEIIRWGTRSVWYKNGKKHRLNNPADIIENPAMLELFQQIYYLEGYTSQDEEYKKIKIKYLVKDF